MADGSLRRHQPLRAPSQHVEGLRLTPHRLTARHRSASGAGAARAAPQGRHSMGRTAKWSSEAWLAGAVICAALAAPACDEGAGRSPFETLARDPSFPGTAGDPAAWAGLFEFQPLPGCAGRSGRSRGHDPAADIQRAWRFRRRRTHVSGCAAALLQPVRRRLQHRIRRHHRALARSAHLGPRASDRAGAERNRRRHRHDRFGFALSGRTGSRPPRLGRRDHAQHARAVARVRNASASGAQRGASARDGDGERRARAAGFCRPAGPRRFARAVRRGPGRRSGADALRVAAPRTSHRRPSLASAR